MPAKKTAVIIGAGAGGLALANILARAGLSVHVYEKNGTPGGRMDILKAKGFTFDTGPSWYLMKDVFEQYFGLFNKKTSDYYELARLDPGYKVFYEDSQPICVGGDLGQTMQSFEQLEKGSSIKLQKYLDKGEANYRAALLYFLYNPFKQVSNLANKEIARALPSFAGIFTRSLHGYVSKHFARLELQQILEYPSVFLGASPFNTPALYQLMSYLDFKEGVFYPKTKGMYAITESLCQLGKDLDVNYHYDADVSKILVNNGAAYGVVANGKTVAADLVISNADLHFTETKLLEQQHQSYSKRYWSKRKAGPSALLLYLGIKGSLPELEHHNLFFVKNWRANFDKIYKEKVWPKQASIYVSRTTATDPSTAPKGHENLFVLVPLPPGTTEADYNVDEYVDAYLAQLEEMSGIADLRQRIVFKEIRTPDHFGLEFNAWQNTALGMSHTLRQTAFLRPSVKSKKVANLYYVGAGAQPGIGVPLCLISAQLVYKHLVKDWSAGAVKSVNKVSL